jgi:putative transposase
MRKFDPSKDYYNILGVGEYADASEIDRMYRIEAKRKHPDAGGDEEGMKLLNYQQERFSAAKGQSDLVLRRDGKWFLLVSVELPAGTPIPTTNFIGVDMGTVHLATDNDGQHFDSSEVEATRQHYEKKRRQLQRKATSQQRQGKRPKKVRRKLKALSGRERRFKRDTNHVISKAIVVKAKGSLRGIALENLEGIRNRTKFRRSQRGKMAKWAFAELRAFIEYKARLAGIPVSVIDPAYTSQMCSECGHTEGGNRYWRGVIWCKACGHFDNADVNAAKNISMKASVNMPNVAETQVASAA